MTHAEYRKELMGECKNAATDCKDAADYAAYNFEKGREEEARRYTAMLEERVSTLKASISSLDYVNKKIREHGPDASGN